MRSGPLPRTKGRTSLAALTALGALAAALLLTGCDSGGTSGADGGTSAAAGGTDDGQAPATATHPCTAEALDSQLGPVNAAPAAGDTGSVTVTITNTGADCTLEGFPEVRLTAAGAAVPVPRHPAARAQPLTLAGQGAASFTLTYVRGAEGRDSIAADTAAYTLPGGSAPAFDFPWSYGAVARKDGGPAATVSALQAAGD
ncbi:MULTISPECIES: DUF4232 domain-containing protein [unclassified Streptomyces]|uniref:DUF4232 domain-containing protein n=1 Tax=unclassified Streptomyces TaxID=2593676 RepID=UPI003D73E034